MVQRIHLLVSSLFVIAAIAVTGCTSIPGNPPATTPATPTATTAPVSTPTVTTIETTGSMVTETIPPQYNIEVSISKDRVYNTITVTFDGGPGQIFVQGITATVTTSDGTMTTKAIPQQGQIQEGASVEFQGTKGQDRVEVWATINGQTYKIRDEYAYLPSY